LYLIGYRASGKSTVAPLLSSRLGFGCIDTDRLIEAELSEPIATFFARQGESAFRQIESRIVVDVSQESGQVVSLGGGAVLARANQEAIRSTGKVVWLQCPPTILAQRLMKDQTQGALRPSLTGLGVTQEIELVLKQREGVYRELADFVVDAGPKSPEQIATEIVAWWQSLPK
jgi:shikimate kinase